MKRTIRRRDRVWHNAYTGSHPAGVTAPTTTKQELTDDTGGPHRRN